MRIEHVAYNVQDPPAMAAWYVENLGFEIKRSMEKAPQGHFLADGSGTVMIEIYRNPTVDVPDYAAMNPAVLHLAMTSDGVAADFERLVAAGATSVEQPNTVSAGDVVAMLRDPWGLAVQLVKRESPMV